MSNKTWSESAITYNTRPAIDGSGLWSVGAVSRNAWITMDVTWAVVPGGILSAGMSSTNADLVSYDSRESGLNAPQLVVTQTFDSPPPAGSGYLYAAGDIARCDSTKDDATALLLDGTTGE